MLGPERHGFVILGLLDQEAEVRANQADKHCWALGADGGPFVTKALFITGGISLVGHGFAACAGRSAPRTSRHFLCGQLLCQRYFPAPVATAVKREQASQGVLPACV